MRTIRLTKGLGKQGKSHCVMAATSIVAGEPFTDKPQCVCPTIAAALIVLNDSYGDRDELREQHLSHLPWLIIGTRGTLGDEIERAFRFAKAAAKAAAEAARWAESQAVRSQAAWAAKAVRAAKRALEKARVAAIAARVAAIAARVAAIAARDGAGEEAVRLQAVWAARDAAESLRWAVTAARLAMVAEDPRVRFVRFIETDIVPVATTMPIEPGFNRHLLISAARTENTVTECQEWPGQGDAWAGGFAANH